MRKNKLLKVLTLVTVLFMIFTACATTAEEIIPEYDPSIDKEDIDLLGYEYTFAAITHGASYPLNPQSGADSRGDKLLQRYKDTEEKFNVKINVIDGLDMTRFMNLYAADMKYADLMFAMTNTIVTGKYLQNGYMIPFSDMNIDLNSGLYGPPQALEAGYFNEQYYAIIAYYWGFPAADTMPAMWFNPRVLYNFQQPTPHELDEQGEWTWDKLEELCETVRDTSDPDKNMHTYALAYTSQPYLEIAALFSNNARIVEKGADGKLKYALNSKEAIEAMDFIRGLVERDLLCDGGDRQNITPFVENRRAFFLEFTHLGLGSEGATNLAYRMEEAYEWIYFPKGPSATKETSGTSYSYYSRFFYAPTNSDKEIHEVLLPYMFQPLPGDTIETWQDEFERQTFFTTTSFDYFKILRDEAFFDYTPYIPFDNFMSKLLAITKGNATAAETFSELEDKYQASLDNLYNAYIG